jgi:hypothetical protein
MIRLALVLVVAAGCKGGYDKDWTGHKLVATDDVVEGVKYRITIPDGLTKIDSYVHGWDDAKPEGDYIPKVFTHVSPYTELTMERALASSTRDPAKTNLVRKDTRADGFAFTDIATDKHAVHVVTFKKAGARYLQCSASQQTDSGELPSFDATRAMLEKICDSIEVR